MIAVASTMLIGFCQFLGGLWKLVAGGRMTAPNVGAPPPVAT
jgi:hypothetical protein